MNRRDVWLPVRSSDTTNFPEKADCSPKTDRGAMLMEPGTPLPDETSQTVVDLKYVSSVRV